MKRDTFRVPLRRPLRRPSIVTALALVITGLASMLAACSSDGDGYQVTAVFPRTIALYEESDVLVMGVPIGSVSNIEIAGDRVEVTMRINDGVPLPADVTAAIMPRSLIGERNVILGPAWKPGDDRLGDGATIPRERTQIPVEPDEALESITELLEALEPEAVARILAEGSEAIDGTGPVLNSTLSELATLVPYLAEQDDRLVAVAEDVHTLAETVRSREQEVSRLLEQFANVSATLAEERQSIVQFIEAVADLSAEGRALLVAYETTIPEDLNTVAEVSLTIQANGDALRETLLAFASTQDGFIEAYIPEEGSLRARVFTSAVALEPLREALELLGVAAP